MKNIQRYSYIHFYFALILFSFFNFSSSFAIDPGCGDLNFPGAGIEKLAGNIQKIVGPTCDDNISEEDFLKMKRLLVDSYKAFHKIAFENGVMDLTWMRINMKDSDLGKGRKHECHVNAIFQNAYENNVCKHGEFEDVELDMRAQKIYDKDDEETKKRRKENIDQQIAKILSVFEYFEKTKGASWKTISGSPEIEDLRKEIGFKKLKSMRNKQEDDALEENQEINRFVLLRFFFEDRNPDLVSLEKLRNWYLEESKKQDELGNKTQKVALKFYESLAERFTSACSETKDRLIKLCSFLENDSLNYDLNEKQFNIAKKSIINELLSTSFEDKSFIEKNIEKYECRKKKSGPSWKLNGMPIPDEVSMYDKIAKKELKYEDPEKLMSKDVKLSENDKRIINSSSQMIYPNGAGSLMPSNSSPSSSSSPGQASSPSSQGGNSGNSPQSSSSGNQSSLQGKNTDSSFSSNSNSSLIPGRSSYGNNYNFDERNTSLPNSKDIQKRERSLEESFNDSVKKNPNFIVSPDSQEREKMMNMEREIKNLQERYKEVIEREKLGKKSQGAKDFVPQNSSSSSSISSGSSSISSSPSSLTSASSSMNSGNSSLSSSSASLGAASQGTAPIVNSSKSLLQNEQFKGLPDSFRSYKEWPELLLTKEKAAEFIKICSMGEPNVQRICYANLIKSFHGIKASDFVLKYSGAGNAGMSFGFKEILNKKGELVDILQIQVSSAGPIDTQRVELPAQKKGERQYQYNVLYDLIKKNKSP